MHGLTPTLLAFLDRFGFDAALQQGWQRDLASGRLTKAANLVDGPLVAPPPGTLQELPPPGSGEWAGLERRGREAIAAGACGIAVLNGGMATRFGGVVKGIVPVLDERRTFLALCIEDALRSERQTGGRVPVFLMNSFATDEATRDHLAARHWFGADPARIVSFTQSVALRMTPAGELFRRADGAPSPYGPGHGDFPAAFRKSGCLAQFQASGGRWIVLRNVDNLGARLDPAILGHHLASGCAVTVELAPKRPGDVGGAPYLLRGRTQLVEQLRFPPGFDPDIVNVFNTNTMILDVAALDRDFPLGWYYVEKVVDGRPAVQIEHLVGELTAHLPTNFLRVGRDGPRSRFLPIKEPADLDRARADVIAMYN